MERWAKPFVLSREENHESEFGLYTMESGSTRHLPKAALAGSDTPRASPGPPPASLSAVAGSKALPRFLHTGPTPLPPGASSTRPAALLLSLPPAESLLHPAHPLPRAPLHELPAAAGPAPPSRLADPRVSNLLCPKPLCYATCQTLAPPTADYRVLSVHICGKILHKTVSKRENNP